MSRVIALRKAGPEEIRDFVLNSWVDSYRMSHFSGPIPMPLYRDMMKECVRWISQRDDIEIIVAYKPGEAPPDDAYGWICVEGNINMRIREYDYARRGMYDVEKPVPQGKIVHFIFVKNFFRKNGIARALFKAAGIDPRERFICTAKTATSSRLMQLAKVPFMTFDPRLARFPKNRNEDNTPGEYDE